MCRLIGFSVDKPLEKPVVDKLITFCRDTLKDQKDGFGYALSGGEVDGITHLRLTAGHWLGFGVDPLNDWESVGKPNHDSRGLPVPCTAGLFHGRISTNDLGIHNTHPFVSDDLALAHNGIVTYTGPKRAKKGTCDSEDLFNTFTIGEGWDELHRYYSGYAALLILNRNGKLTLYRDETPKLYVVRFDGGFVVATNAVEGANVVTQVFDKLPQTPFLINANTVVETHEGVITGKTKVKSVKSRTYEKDKLSLGTGKYASSSYPSYDYGYGYGSYGGYYNSKKYDKASKKSKGKKKKSKSEESKKPSHQTSSFIEGFDDGYDDFVEGVPYSPPQTVDQDFRMGYHEGYSTAEKEAVRNEALETGEDVSMISDAPVIVNQSTLPFNDGSSV